MAPVAIRGTTVARNELMIVTGQLLAYSFNAFIAVMWPHAHVWRWMLVICSVPAIALWIGIHLLPESVTRSYLVLLFMLTFLFSMQCFTGPTFWLMLAEMFPMRVRGLANGVAVFCNWMGNVIVAFAFPNLIAAVQGNTFFVFTVINALTLAFYARFLPETFGHTLESLERHFEEKYS